MTRHLVAALLGALLLSGCAGRIAPFAPAEGPPAETTGWFAMPDGERLPYRTWLPSGTSAAGQGAAQAARMQGGAGRGVRGHAGVALASSGRAVGAPQEAGAQDGEPWAVILALNGMNDSRDAWEYPAPDLAAAGIAVYAPDLRGFGATAGRGRWPGTGAFVADTRAMARALRTRYPHSKLILMGESMGAAVLMALATSPDPPPADGYVLIAPAVWGRAEMNLFLRASLWVVSNAMPGFVVPSGMTPTRMASDNRAAIRRLSTDPLTIRETRVDAVRGLVDLMDAALAAAPRFHAPALFMAGGKDELIPEQATSAVWHALPGGERLAFYPGGYHLLLRDSGRETPIGDVVAWIRDPGAPLPSGADRAAASWLAERK